MKDLTVFILTHNRKELLLETIQSILHQTCHDFKLVISDNSTDNKTFDLLVEKKLLDKLEYRKRDKEYSPFDHFNLCLSEVKTKYFILFHDDDIMMPNMIQTLYDVINESAYMAVGCNCFFIHANKITNKKMMKECVNVVLTNNTDLFNQYYKCSIVPYPSYIYNKNMIGEMYFVENAGKYSDVVTLSNWLEKGKMYWISKPLFYYRLHSSQSSAQYSYREQLKLIKVFNNRVQDKKIMRKYRLQQLYRNTVYQRLFYNRKDIFAVRILRKESLFNFYLKYLIKVAFLKTM
jgi:putative glycosyltransferase O-antigen related protein